MSLKNALIGFKKQLEDKATDEKIAKMLAEQSDILNNGTSKDVNVAKNTKPKKWFDESVLSNGGNTHYKLNDKWYRISVDSKRVDVEYTQFKFHTTTALGYVLYISAKTYKDAQDVVDDIFGKKGLYLVSAT